MILTFRSSDFLSLSLNNVPLDPTTWQATRWVVSTDETFAPESLLLDTWFYGDYAGSPWTTAQALADNPNISALTLDEITFDAGVIVGELYLRLYQRDSLGIISDPGETTLSKALRPLERAWAFFFDGHVFYVMNYILQPSLIYDVATQQWYEWFTNGVSLLGSSEPYWNMFRGVVWKGRTLAADLGAPKIWEVSNSPLDEGEKAIKRLVTGFQDHRGTASVRQGSMRITARKEDPAESATLTMRFSDDGGNTWSTERTVVLGANSYAKNIEFRSLGRIRAPGRIWEISDVGGYVTIAGADADIEGIEDLEEAESAEELEPAAVEDEL
jgi:hypothetical protein